MFNAEQRKALLELARQSIASRFSKEAVIYPDDQDFQIQSGVFVSLHKHGELRGCIGYIKGFKDLVPSIIDLARSAAFQDPRFSPVRHTELPELNIEISIMSDLYPVNDVKDVLIGRDGLFLEHPMGSGLLLPQVPVEWHWDLTTFLDQICRKAGLRAGSWEDDKAKLYRFTAEIFSESEINSD